MNLIEAYGVRVIEGVDKNYVLNCGKRDLLGGKGFIITDPYGREIQFECVTKYFKPVKRYFRFGPNDSCAKIARAMGLSVDKRRRCIDCFAECLTAKREIKHPK